MDKIIDAKCVLASSSSAMPASKFTEKMSHRSQCLVAHPINPPFLCPLVEVVPAPYTSEEAVEVTMSIMKEVGQSPVFLKKELPGFALNRIQCALLTESWRLIEDDAISVEDLDTIMKDGLGMRYAFMGPMETINLNAEGVESYCDRYGQMIYDVTNSFGPVPKMGGETAKNISKELEKRIPLEKLDERRKWRDVRLAALAKLKKELGDKE